MNPLSRIESRKLVTAILVPFFSAIFIGMIVLASRLPRTSELSATEPKLKEIFAISNGVHVDLIIPKTDFLSLSSLNWPFPEASDESKKSMAFGWGDENFFFNHDTWASVKFKDILQAAFFSEGSAIRVSFLDNQETSGATRVALSSMALKALVKEIDASFISNDSLRVVRRRANPNTALFFEARGHYSILNNCNNWTASILRAGSVPTPVMVTNAHSIMRILRLQMDLL